MSHKKHQNAVVFTLFYPYSTFDYYVDIEIEMICNHFEKVYVIPISIEKSIERILPKNAVLVDSNFQPSPLSAIFKAVFSLLYWKEILLAFRHKKLSKALFKHLTLQHSKVSFLLKILKSILLEDRKVKWVYSHWLLEGVYAAAQLKEAFDFVLVTKAHSLDINNYIPFIENAVKQINQIHFISDLGKQYFNTNHAFQVPQSKQFVSRLGIVNGLPLKDYHTSVPFKIISVSYIYPLKRVDLILEAISKITDFEIEWHHIGAYYANHTQAIKSKAENLLKDKSNIKIVWLGDFSIPQVYEHYKNNDFDLFISASSSEGIPVSMMECMSFGIPVFSTDVGGVKEIIEHGINGYLVDSNPTSDTLAKTINLHHGLLEQDRSNMRLRAFQKWKNTYNADINFKQFLELAIPPSN
jgi:colanic acid/amylovoran biosynthesis glycosyltransferase